jgi:uncharacterized protein (DUF1015 family)
VQHTVWRVSDPAQIADIKRAFEQLDSLYIADGHHRAAAAVAIGLKRRAAARDTLAGLGSPNHGDPCEQTLNSDHFLAVLFPSDQLRILDYNRVVFSLGEQSHEELLDKIRVSFDVTPTGEQAYRPSTKGEFALYLPGMWYRLVIHDEYRNSDPVDGLDVSLLHNNLLAPFLGIDDPRTSENIAYVGGVRGLEELQQRVDKGAAAAFALYPASLDELFAVADIAKLMPPKSTWFEPKPRSGLFIHKI